MGWTIELERVAPYRDDEPHFWCCRIRNEDLGFLTSDDGRTPDEAVRRAKAAILRHVWDEIDDLLREMEAVAALEPAPRNA